NGRRIRRNRSQGSAIRPEQRRSVRPKRPSRVKVARVLHEPVLRQTEGNPCTRREISEWPVLAQDVVRGTSERAAVDREFFNQVNAIVIHRHGSETMARCQRAAWIEHAAAAVAEVDRQKLAAL